MSPRVRELRIMYTAHPSGATLDRALTTPAASAAVLVAMLEHQAQEVGMVALLNTRLKLIAVHEVSRGGIDHCTFDPFIVFRAALLANAPTIILAHNHPSGDPTPSPDDIAVTRALVQAGQLLNISVADHLIVGDRAYYSLKEHGIL